MDISGILAAANPDNSKTAASKTQFGQNYDQFLTLLTTQLKNQDPLSPMDSAAFTNQLVQFSNVEQQIRSNDYLQKLLTLNTLSLTGIGLGYVGLNVYSPGNSFQFTGTAASDISYAIPAGAARGSISIMDSSGTTVYSTSANIAAGQHTFSWNGKDNNGNIMDPGSYTVAVGAQDAQGNALSTKTYTSGLVQGIETGDDGNVSVVINGKLVPVTDVQQATLQGYAPASLDTSGT